MINSFTDSLRESAAKIMEVWLKGDMTDTEAICQFVALILSNR